VAITGLVTNSVAQQQSRPTLRKSGQPASADWLIDSSPFKASVYPEKTDEAIVVSNGLVARTFRTTPNAATIELQDLQNDNNLLRGVKPEAVVSIDGKSFNVGGLTGQPNYAYLKPEWLADMKSDPNAFHFDNYKISTPTERFAWKRLRHHAPDIQWPPPGTKLQLNFLPPESAKAKLDGVRVSVFYELYDGIPVFCKWIQVHNGTDRKITVDKFTSEMLAVVEFDSRVETRTGVPIPEPESIHVETDFAFGGFTAGNANRHIVHWRTDPQYKTQVNYLRQTPCLLVVEPTYGPAQDIQPGKTFTSCRAFELIYDSTDRERRSLALRKMYRTIAPWVTENPLMHHMRIAKPEAVRTAIDQAAEVGFEMIILSFGSGFNMENDDPQYLKQWQEIADYARSKKIEIGAYSLLSSRRIGGGNNIVSPKNTKPTHGNCPALTSEWGQAYYRKLYNFFETTGFTLLEHDGPYPGDVDITPRPPLQKGEPDSRWVQAKIANDFYRWCRTRGVYINAPDYYYLNGTNKCGMGYREVNWSLPREMQVIHTRQNIFDGTWYKTPSMGWMFVPLTQYHGGGAAATIEPLDEHRDHYQKMIESNLGLGVQACFRGPRLFDTDRTRKMIKSQVDWYKKYRDILESDVIHGRRADGRDIDWMLHVNPKLKNKGMLLVYNPLKKPVEKKLRVNLYYTGLTDTATILSRDSNPQTLKLDRKFNVDIDVRVEPESMHWYLIR
jgi:hypothetical protein